MEVPGKMRLWLDVDDLFFFASRCQRPTGIQRLSAELYRALVEVGPEQVRFLVHADTPQGFAEVEWSRVEAAYNGLTLQEAGAPPETWPAVVPGLPQAPAPQGLLDRLKALLGQRPPEVPAPVLCSAEAGDVLLALGAPWHDLDYAARIRRFKASTGARYALLIHDLIPILRPEFFEVQPAATFESFMRACLPLVDHVLSNSDSTGRDVQRWSKAAGLDLPAAVTVPIGETFAPPPPLPGEKPIIEQPYVLFVSTIEIRKNHWQAFNVWRRLLESMPKDQVPLLVFAGARGWMIDDLFKALESSGHLGGKVRVLHGLDDRQLANLYRHCAFTLFLSHYEGWGLPVTDSLAFGKVCVSSDRSSMPEAGGDFCVYVDPDNTSGTVETVRRLLADHALLDGLEKRIKTEFVRLPWRHSAQVILRTLSGAVAGTGQPATSRDGVSPTPVSGQ